MSKHPDYGLISHGKKNGYIVPAIRDEVHEIHHGSWKDNHGDLMKRHAVPEEDAQCGYYDKKKREFIHSDIDTTSLLTNPERFRKYGVEEGTRTLLRFRQYLKEVKLSKLAHTLDKGDPIATLSPDRDGVHGKEKRSAHKAMQKVLKRLGDKGIVSWSGKHAGRYKYDEKEKPSKEGAYVVRPGSNPQGKRHFDKIIKGLGSRFKQQSVMKVQGPAKTAKGEYHYTDGERKGEVEDKGTIHYNYPLKKDGGDTKLRSSGSFTVREKDKK